MHLRLEVHKSGEHYKRLYNVATPCFYNPTQILTASYMEMKLLYSKVLSREKSIDFNLLN